MINAKEMHAKILRFLSEQGPSLPMVIAKRIGISSLFASAFLSELVGERKVRISNLKVGGSPLYYLEGQEERLGEFSEYLHPKELEIFLLLKKSGVLRDSDQDAAGRVALRSLKDFAVGFTNDDEIYWKYIGLTDETVRQLFAPPAPAVVVAPIAVVEKVSGVNEAEPLAVGESVVIQEIVQKKVRSSSAKKVVPQKLEQVTFENTLVYDEQKKEKPRSVFVEKIVKVISEKGITIIEELAHKTKEYTCIVEIRSELGPIKFLTQAKDKKTISESDLRKLLSEGQKIPLPVLVLYTGEISKKGKELLESYSSVI